MRVSHKNGSRLPSHSAGQVLLTLSLLGSGSFSEINAGSIDLIFIATLRVSGMTNHTR